MDRASASSSWRKGWPTLARKQVRSQASAAAVRIRLRAPYGEVEAPVAGGGSGDAGADGARFSGKAGTTAAAFRSKRGAFVPTCAAALAGSVAAPCVRRLVATPRGGRSMALGRHRLAGELSAQQRRGRQTVRWRDQELALSGGADGDEADASAASSCDEVDGDVGDA
eukprot:CAMPEP_0170445872 /NCGR_PEP_ID=MMETSP0117_2-20130122/49299_1 /TAXON_ID=400756 /ORGANISM="Durinskia baltica, Strain CSIRO CS-38" /LENGTH=167 /DNA_ID=CAMNT_0010706789 /DNA_START=49 /DNA_END=552 /DNA_ORIENTATION=-